jgi:hypothetical protein
MARKITGTLIILALVAWVWAGPIIAPHIAPTVRLAVGIAILLAFLWSISPLVRKPRA